MKKGEEAIRGGEGRGERGMAKERVGRCTSRSKLSDHLETTDTVAKCIEVIIVLFSASRTQNSERCE